MARASFLDILRTWLRLALAVLLVSLGGLAQAVPSACTALWGTGGTNLLYYNTASNSWVTAAALGFSANSMGGYEKDGTLYFTSGVTPGAATMYRATFSNTTGTITVAQVSATPISTPDNLTYTNSLGVQTTIASAALVGATLDRDTVNRRMFLYLTSNVTAPGLPVDGGGTATVAAIGVLDPESPTAVSWSMVYQSTGTGTVTYPKIGSSGDIFADQQSGQLWIVTNTNPQRMLKVNTSYAGYTIASAQVVSTATIQVGGVGITNSVGAVGVDPDSGFVYIGDGNGNVTWQVQDHTAAPVAATVDSATTGATDAGNCVAPPDPPTITKSFNPSTATTPGTATLMITITNPNKVPIFTTQPMTDTFPSGMAVHTVPSLAVSCFSDGVATTPSQPPSTTLTGAAGATRVAINSGALIPGGVNGGSCSFSVRVSATVASFYNNTIPAGSLTTSAGSNTAAASDTFQVQNLSLPNPPTVSKSFNPTTSSSAIGTTTLTIVITNPNTSTNTLTSSLTDTLPANMRITAPSLLTVSCFSNGSPVATPASTVATTATTRITIVSGSAIPGGASGGSCSFAVRVTATVASFNLNTIPAGSLTMVSGANADAATASFYLRAADFSATKSQREGASGGTTTANLDIASAATISYVINIRNEGGVAGTRTFIDTLPVLVTPVLSITPAAVGGATGCSAVTSTVAGATRVSGTVTGAPDDGGCDLTILARVSTTATVSTVTNSVGIYTVTGSLDTSATNNSATVVMTIKPAANLSVSKTDGKAVLLTGATNTYTITVANGGPAAADGTVLKDPATPGLDCTTITCSTSGGASCPLPAQLFVSALQSGTGLSIPDFPASSTVTFVLTCTVTATGS